MLGARRARQLFALHRWTGLWTGAVICFLSVTGSIAVFNPEIDEWLNPELLVTSPDAAARDIGIDVALRNVWRQTHVRFFAFGWQGRVVVGAFGVTLLVSTVTGFLIYGRFIKALPRWWSIRKGRSLQISLSDWHKLVGILALVFNLIIAVTGSVLGLENLARFSSPVLQAIHPAPGEAVLANVPATLEGAIPLSAAVARVRAVIDGFEPGYVVLPIAGEGHYQILGNLSGRIEISNASGAVVHALTGEVLYRHSAREARLVTKAYNWMDPLHFGEFGGVATKLLWMVLGLTSGFLSISGFMIWWLKTRRRRPRVNRRGLVAGEPVLH